MTTQEILKMSFQEWAEENKNWKNQDLRTYRDAVKFWYFYEYEAPMLYEFTRKNLAFVLLDGYKAPSFNHVINELSEIINMEVTTIPYIINELDEFYKKENPDE